MSIFEATKLLVKHVTAADEPDREVLHMQIVQQSSPRPRLFCKAYNLPVPVSCLSSRGRHVPRCYRNSEPTANVLDVTVSHIGIETEILP